MPPENNPPPPSPNLATQFLAEEYKALREEIKSLVAENQTMERFAGGAVAAVITWLLTTKGISDFAMICAAFIPLAITLIAGLRCYGIGLRLGQIGAYISTYEAWVMQASSAQSPLQPTGWETKFLQMTGSAPENNNPSRFLGILKYYLHRSPFYFTAKTYWAGLFTISLVFLVISIVDSPAATTTLKGATVTVSDPSGSSSTVTVPLGFTIEVKRPAN